MQNNIRGSLAIRIAKEAIEQLDRAHDAGNLAVARNAARMLDRFSESVHAALETIEPHTRSEERDRATT
jgi:hypothetical protein